jgi:hypothetical protein
MEDSCNGSPNEDLDNILRKRITVVEITKAKMTLQNGKSTGWDDIPNEFLKYGGDHLDTAIATVFTNMIEDEWTPAEWNDEKLTMIHKKGDKNKCENYRGIMCSSNLSKLFTRILIARVTPFIEDKKVLGEMQNGFRRGRGTTDNLLILSTLLEKGKREGKQMHLCFIDLKRQCLGKNSGRS